MKLVVLHLIPTLEGGGAERQLSLVSKEYARRGGGVHIGCRRGGVYEESLCNSEVEVHLLGDHRGVRPALVASVNALVKKIEPDLIHTWLPQMDLVGGGVALWNSIPWIVSERTSELAYLNMKIVAWVRCRLARHANAVIANSSNGVAYWNKKLVANTSIFQVANAVDVDAIRSAQSVPIESSDLNNTEKNILVVGRLSPEKALEVIIQAVRLVPVEYQINVLIIGEGPLQENIKLRIKEADLENRISLLPYTPSWWSMLKSASALISMSRFEGQPNVVLETMAAGCPLIVSDIPAHREFLDKDSAILVALDNPDSLVDAIISLLANPEAARQRAEYAVKKVEKLSIRAMADAYESIYEKAVIGGIR